MSTFTNEQVEALAGMKLNSTVRHFVHKWRLEGSVEPTLQPYGPWGEILPYPGIRVRVEVEDIAELHNATPGGTSDKASSAEGMVETKGGK